MKGKKKVSDEETGEYAEGGCEEAATHHVVGPHDRDCGSYCKAHAERVKSERCNPPHRFQLSQLASCDGLSEARSAAIRTRGAGGGA